jgi:hypothetical protein
MNRFFFKFIFFIKGFYISELIGSTFTGSLAFPRLAASVLKVHKHENFLGSLEFLTFIREATIIPGILRIRGKRFFLQVT